MKYIIVYYHEFGYTVCACEHGQIIEELYSAGNNRNSSATTDSVPLDDPNCVPLLIMEQLAKHTGRQIAREQQDAVFLGVEYDDNEIEAYLASKKE